MKKTLCERLRAGALTRFLGSVTPDDTDHLRRALGGHPPGEPGD